MVGVIAVSGLAWNERASWAEERTWKRVVVVENFEGGITPSIDVWEASRAMALLIHRLAWSPTYRDRLHESSRDGTSSAYDRGRAPRDP